MEKYGFIYIWYDRKHKRYYIGSHWGTENDGYICSSNWMRDAYKRRPKDFKRRILKRIYTERSDLYNEETKYLQMIKVEEVRVRYYNLHTIANHWSASEKDRLTISQKISMANKGKTKGKKRNPMTEETKAKLRERWLGIPKGPRSEETRKKISDNSKRLQAEGKIGTKGKQYSDKSRKKMSERQIGKNNPMFGKKHTDASKRKISEAVRARLVVQG